ncbi:MAG: hypothetical protein AAFX78_02040 [Cyanobacteria bacterium J06638_20]
MADRIVLRYGTPTTKIVVREQGPPGPQGVQGEPGSAGSPGPEGPQGIQGPTGANGADGVPGADGANGADGRTIFNGSEVPSSGLGADGDFYLDTSTNTLYGPKTSGAWGSGISLVGPQGPAGANGADGSQGPQGDPGPAGPQGIQGPAGDDGADGASAYQIWLDQGNTGTELDFLTGGGGERFFSQPRSAIHTGTTNRTLISEIEVSDVEPGDFLELFVQIACIGNPSSGTLREVVLENGSNSVTLASQDTNRTVVYQRVGTFTANSFLYQQNLNDPDPSGSPAYGQNAGVVSIDFQQAVYIRVYLTNGNTSSRFEVAQFALRRFRLGGSYGASAYQIWLAQGNSGSQADFLNSLIGVQGPAGVDGADGTQGPQGIQGEPGSAGPPGPEGLQGIQGPAGVNGADGAPGADGADGADGRTILNSSGVPSSGLGADGDFYLDTSTNILYGPKTSGAWGSGISLVGPQGPAGANGADGSQGLQGDPGPAGPQGIQGPAGADGADGTPGADGADGTDGKTVRSGSGAPASGLGVDGDFYIDTTSNELYGPKTSGAWGGGVSLVGPQGATGADGAQGAQGDPGPEGPQGIQGPAGADGAPGADGADGSPDTAAQIRDKLQTLSVGNRLNYGFLDNPPLETRLERETGTFAAATGNLITPYDIPVSRILTHSTIEIVVPWFASGSATKTLSLVAGVADPNDAIGTSITIYTISTTGNAGVARTYLYRFGTSVRGTGVDGTVSTTAFDAAKSFVRIRLRVFASSSTNFESGGGFIRIMQ